MTVVVCHQQWLVVPTADAAVCLVSRLDVTTRVGSVAVILSVLPTPNASTIVTFNTTAAPAMRATLEMVRLPVSLAQLPIVLNRLNVEYLVIDSLLAMNMMADVNADRDMSEMATLIATLIAINASLKPDVSQSLVNVSVLLVTLETVFGFVDHLLVKVSSLIFHFLSITLDVKLLFLHLYRSLLAANHQRR